MTVGELMHGPSVEILTETGKELCHVALNCKNALVHAHCCSLFENHFKAISAVSLMNSANMTVGRLQEPLAKSALS